MTISSRHYIFEEGGSLKRVPLRIVNALPFGGDALPEYAGTRQKVVSVIIENQDGKPVRILDAQGSYWEFDDKGQIDESLRKTVGEAMSFAFDHADKNSKVVHLSSKLKRRQFDAKHRWEPTKDDLGRIAADIWPASNGAGADVKTVKGKAPKKPPLTYEAKQALSEIQGNAASIGRQIQSLSEPALKGLAFEARQLAAMYPEEPCLWRGIADECDRQREILGRYRSGKGVWYAVVEIFRKEDSFSSRSVDVKFKKCIGKQAAIEAARKLLAENACKFSDDFPVEASIHCDLEWIPPDD